MPEVALVAILMPTRKASAQRDAADSDHRTSRAQRGRPRADVCGYDNRLDARVIDETNRRREMQIAYNRKHGITPKTIVKDAPAMIEITKPVKDAEHLTKSEAMKKAAIIEKQMRQAAMELEFEAAAALRDELFKLKEYIRNAKS